MMKKTLLSIITMAIVTSSTAYAAHSVQKDIVVEAEIVEPLILTKADGSPLNSLKLLPDLEYTRMQSSGPNRDPRGSQDPIYLGVRQAVKITANQGAKVKISLAEDFDMLNTGRKSLSPSVYIDNLKLDFGKSHKLMLDNKAQTSELRVVGAPPRDAEAGEKYTGILKLVMESVP